jgi:hypothetical protein
MNASEGKTFPMGSEVKMSKNPRFQAEVKGSFKQLAGCPKYVVDTLSEKRLDKMAQGECYYPSDERYGIDRIEVIKIRPQSFAGEEIPPLIEDPWRTFDCGTYSHSCSIEFVDPEFSTEGRDALYYVRAIEEPVSTINAGNLRVKFDDEKSAIDTEPCFGDYRTEPDDNCQQPLGQQAWSSPIFVDHK